MRHLWCLLFLLLGCASAAAQPLVLDERASGRWLNDGLMLLEDPGARLDLQQAREQDAAFVPAKGRTSVGQSPNPWWLRLDLERALALLAPQAREVLLLVGMEQLSYAETAQMLGIPIGTVMSRRARAREQLRRLMEGAARSRTVLKAVK